MDVKTLLIADDDPLFRGFLRRALEQGGYRVVEAKDGTDALLKLRQLLPSLALMDYDFGQPPNGAQVVALLRQEERLRALPVVFATGSDVRHVTGVQGVLQKPVDPDHLLAMVASIL